MPAKRWTRLVAVVAAVAFLAACSGDDDPQDADRAAEETEQTGNDTSDEGTTEPSGNDGTLPDGPVDGGTEAAGETTLTPRGLGQLTIGMSQDAADATGLVDGTWDPTCSLSGEEETTALLVEPLIGQVTALDGAVATILVIDESVTTDPGGVGVGTTRADAEAAFTAAGLEMVVDESTVETMGEFFWTATDGTGDLFAGSIDPATGEVTAVATPRIPICE